MHRNDRAAAIEFVGKWSSLQHDVATASGHPRVILAAHRRLTAPVKPKVYVEARVIQRVAARPPLTVHDAHLIEAIGSKVRRINALAAHAVGEGPEAFTSSGT